MTAGTGTCSRISSRLDFASMLFSHGIRPVTEDLAKQFGIDRSRFRVHDARFLRELYLRAVEGTR